MQRLGIYTNLESLYQGSGYAAGLHSDPESMRTAAFDFQTPMTVIEIKGKIFIYLKLEHKILPKEMITQVYHYHKQIRER